MRGKENVVADALSRRADHQPVTADNSRPYITLAGISFATMDPQVKEDIIASYEQDEKTKDLGSQDGRMEKDNDLWTYDNRLYVPDGRELRQRLLTDLRNF